MNIENPLLECLRNHKEKARKFNSYIDSQSFTTHILIKWYKGVF